MTHDPPARPSSPQPIGRDRAAVRAEERGREHGFPAAGGAGGRPRGQRARARG